MGKGKIQFTDAVPWPSYFIALLRLVLLAGERSVGGMAGSLAIGLNLKIARGSLATIARLPMMLVVTVCAAG